MYNLPSGSSFYVPFQAWQMDTETRKAGAAEATDVNITGLDQPTTKFSSAVDMFGNSVTAMVDIFGRALTGPSSEANPYVDKYGRPKIGPNSEQVVPSDYNKKLPTSYPEYYAPHEPAGTTYEPYYPAHEPHNGTYEPTWSINPSMPGYSPAPEAKPLTTNFNLTLSTQTQLIVDGRVLADIIKPYLQQDMLSSDASMGSTASYTVA
jgi:hypothetical protein